MSPRCEGPSSQPCLLATPPNSVPSSNLLRVQPIFHQCSYEDTMADHLRSLAYKVYNIHCCPLIHKSGGQVVQSRFGTPVLGVPNISLTLHVLGNSFQEDLLCKSPRDRAVSKQLVVSQIFLLAPLQGGCDVCLFFPVIRTPLTDSTFWQ